MARIRSIKPEFWTSEQIMSLKPITRLLFIGMWNFADDYGRMPFAPATIKAQILPGDAIDLETIKAMLLELSSAGLILLYSANGREYLEITGWAHQKIDKPHKPKHPGPVSDAPRTLSEPSTNIPRTLAVGEERIGEEKKGKDAAPPAQLISLRPPESQERQLYDRGKELLGSSSGGLIKKLVVAKGSVELARAALEMAATKSDPREYLGAIIRGRDGSDDLRARGRSW